MAANQERKHMKREVLIRTLTLVVGIGFGVLGYHVLNAQQTPPTERKGQTMKTIASLDIGPQIPELQGRYLRARLVTYEPGGNGLLHSHKDLPAIIYILRGTFTGCSPDGKCVELAEGQVTAEGKDTTHWAENRATSELAYLVVDIAKAP